MTYDQWNKAEIGNFFWLEFITIFHFLVMAV